MQREGPVRRALPFLLVALALAAAVLTESSASAPVQDQPGQLRPFTLAARKYAFSPAKIEVYVGDLVKITLEAQDIPHSFTIDAYRIAKRAEPGRPAVFEFRADQAGTFPYYCNLTIDEGCRHMRGELVVKARPRG